MNVSREMEIKLFHGHDLGIAASSCPSFNTKGGTLGGLTNASHGRFAENSAEGLGESNRRGRFAL
jgi:hypothetical protein